MSESPDTYAAVAGLIALISDAPACKARLAELQKQIEAATKAQTNLDADRAAHQAEVAAAKATFDARETALRKREVEVLVRSNDLDDRAARLEESGKPWRPEKVDTLGNGLTRERA
jgi:hypothetical protein